MLVLVLRREQDDRVVGIVGLEPGPRLRQIDLPVVELEHAPVVGDARLELFGRRLGLDPIDEPDGVASRVPDAVGGGAPAVQFLEHRKRDDDDVLRSEVGNRIWRGDENAGIDDKGLPGRTCVLWCHPPSWARGSHAPLG